MPFLLCVLSGAQPGTLNTELCTLCISVLGRLCASVRYDLGLCDTARSARFLSAFWDSKQLCQIQSVSLNLLITVPTHLVHSVN